MIKLTLDGLVGKKPKLPLEKGNFTVYDLFALRVRGSRPGLLGKVNFDVSIKNGSRNLAIFLGKEWKL